MADEPEARQGSMSCSSCRYGWGLACGLILVNCAILLSIKAREAKITRQHVEATRYALQVYEQEAQAFLAQSRQAVATVVEAARVAAVKPTPTPILVPERRKFTKPRWGAK